jgi:hypothetical protein
MLLGISEAVDDVHRDNCILHRLINFCFQIARVEDIILKSSYRIDGVLNAHCVRSSTREDYKIEATNFVRYGSTLDPRLLLRPFVVLNHTLPWILALFHTVRKVIKLRRLCKQRAVQIASPTIT